MRRALGSTRVLLALAAALTGCTDDEPAGRPGPPQAVVVQDLPRRAVVQPEAQVRSGDLLVRALAAQCGLTSIIAGTTTREYLPDDPLCWVRVRVVSEASGFRPFTTSAQRLVLEDGTEVAPDLNAMGLKRQPDELRLGGRNAVELDLWFSPPQGSGIRALRVVGEPSVSRAGEAVPAPSVDVRLVGL